MITISELIEYAYNRCAIEIDILIEKKHLIQEQFNNGLIDYMDYSFLIEDVQNDIDIICPIDISFI
jgi:hypothetical protein